MQIHELTNPRRNLSEGPLAALKGIASVAAQGVNTKLGTNIGGAAAGASVGTGAAGQLAAAKLNAPLIQKMGKTMQQTWLTQTLPTLMKQENVAEPALVTPAIQKQELTELINRTLDFDYKSPAVSDTAQGGDAGIDAKQKIAEIEAAIEKIVKYPPAGTGKGKSAQEYTANFTELATAMSALMNLSTFARGASATANPAAPAASQQLSPAAQQLAKKTALNPNQIAALQREVAAGGGQATSGLKDMLGLK